MSVIVSDWHTPTKVDNNVDGDFGSLWDTYFFISISFYNCELLVLLQDRKIIAMPMTGLPGHTKDSHCNRHMCKTRF